MAKSNGRNEAKDHARDQHAALKNELALARTNKKWMLDTLADPRMAKVISHYERSIEDAKEELVNAPKTEVERRQATIIASRSLLATFRGSYDQAVTDAERSLKEFESHNPLFLQSNDKETVNADTGEIKEA